MYIGIVGSRRRNSHKDYKLVEDKFFEIYSEEYIICSGGCSRGGDLFAEKIAKKHGIPILIFYPNYKKYGSPAALFLRNSEIASQSKFLIACVSEERIGGTEDTVTAPDG